MGMEIVGLIRSLKNGTQIIIGTPGRVMDHMRRKTIKMEQVHTVVLDEADEMLIMDQVRILKRLWREFRKNDRQFFSPQQCRKQLWKSQKNSRKKQR